MSIWIRELTLEDLTLRGKKTMSEHLGIEFTEIGEDYLCAKMPVDARTKQPFGIMHGGASCVLAETIASVASTCCIDLEKKMAVGLEINTSHIKMAREGYVMGVARPLHLGKSTHVWEISITNSAGQLISISRLRLAILDK
jgi:1,4-dihydroxy-2-naphthoyl-CoA hydrolase